MIRTPDARAEHLIAYWNAVYRFRHGEREVTLRLDPPIWAPGAAALALPGPWGIITACNPMSRPASDEANAARARTLVRELDRLGLRHEAAINSAPDGLWPEPGRIVWGIGRAILLQLCRDFEQRAAVWASAGGVGLLETATERWMPRRGRLDQKHHHGDVVC